MVDLELLRTKLAESQALRAQGRVVGVTGMTVRIALPGARMGDVVVIRRTSGTLLAEIVGFDAGTAITLPIGDVAGIGIDDEVEATGQGLMVQAGEALLGKVLNGLGQPLDGSALPPHLTPVPVDRAPPNALRRQPVNTALYTGVRVIDGLITLGVGQRVGLFAGSGVGKSLLLGAIARGTSADVIIVALVGERGREVGEFLEHCLGDEGRKRAIVVVATSDAPAIERLRAAQVATALAEFFRDGGKSVLLLVDSITRVARAQREIGLAAGEPPARRGFPPSVFAMLPRLLERSGQGEKGSISAIYTVLVEGGDMDEPISDEVRGILDGHIILDRELAARGHYPAVDVSNSLSRVMPKVVSAAHLSDAGKVRNQLALYEAQRDVISLGAYKKGGDPALDRAILAKPKIDRFVQQDTTQSSNFSNTLEQLRRLASDPAV